jgi:hypothetical protein
MAEEKQRRRRLKRSATFREGFLAVLSCRVPEERGGGVEELGLEPTFLHEIVYATVRKAAGGDTAAARFIRDTVGEKAEERPGGGREPDLSGLTDGQLRELLAGKEERNEQP